MPNGLSLVTSVTDVGIQPNVNDIPVRKGRGLSSVTFFTDDISLEPSGFLSLSIVSFQRLAAKYLASHFPVRKFAAR